MNKLSNTVGERINEFDNMEDNTVLSFNQLFPECPIKNFDLTAEVIIGNVASNNSRMLTINGNHFKHKMFSDMLYGLEREEYFLEHEQEGDDVLGYPI